MMLNFKCLTVTLLLSGSLIALPIHAAKTRSFMDADRSFTFERGSGLYQIRFNYTGKNWTHADVPGIRIHTEKPIAVLPMQYTDPSAMQPGAVVDGRHIGKEWNTITQRALARRLEARGFFVLTPSITQYGEDLSGFQAFEHPVSGFVHSEFAHQL